MADSAKAPPASTHDLHAAAASVVTPRRRPSNANSTIPPSNRQSKRYSVAALYMSMGGVDRDDDIDDELAKAQKHLRELKTNISEQSKRNFVLEKDVRYLDGRIALLIQNKMGIEEQNEVASRLDADGVDGVDPEDDEYFPDRKKTELYGNLFFLLQSEPKHIALLCRLVSMAEIDSLLQTVMFTIYGNQYEQREEHLLLTMFQAVLAHQFETTAEFSSLLRANTPVSRMMTTYTRRGPGQSYLRSALSKCLHEVLERKDINLEINPLKVYEELQDPTDDPFNRPSVSAEQAANHPKVIEIIKPRHTKLNLLATKVLQAIMDSLHQVPYGIRWICKQIRQLTRRKYPDASDAAVCSLIGAFFFLRFVNPAIVTPQAYMLVDRLPSDSSRRTLTLIAKLLQNLANKPTYAKEPYMANLSGFVDSNKSRINEFLNDLCEVPDFYESLEMDQYVALSKKDLSLNITLNEIFGMHSLLDKYRQGVIPNPEGNHLSELLDELGAPPMLVPRSKNAALELSLFNRWETDVGDVDIALDIFRADMIFMEAKSLMINIIRAFPTRHSILGRPLDLIKIADYAAKSATDQGVVKRGLKAMDLLKEIQDSDSDDYETLSEEVDYELKQLGSLREQVEKEARSLEEVYSIIREHNEYLRSQLDTYRSYLNNVRMHTGSKKDRPVDEARKPKPSKFKVVVKKYAPLQLVKDGVVIEWRIPEARLGNLVVLVASPVPGTFVVCLTMKGRPDPLFTLDLKLDDLLELMDAEQEILDLECVVFNNKNLLNMLKRDISKHK